MQGFIIECLLCVHSIIEIESESIAMDMNIFENEPIDLDEIDFTVWQTEDGEWVEIEELTMEQLEEAIYTLKRKLKMLPEHVNEDIWEEYLYILQEEVHERRKSL